METLLYIIVIIDKILKLPFYILAFLSIYVYVFYGSRQEKKRHARSGATDPLEIDFIKMMGDALIPALEAPAIVKYVPTAMIVLWVVFH